MSQMFEESQQVVTFSLVSNSEKKEDYAIPVLDIREIRQLEDLTDIPNSKPYLKGIMNLRGIIIPVIDLKEKLGMNTDNQQTKQMTLIVDVDNSLYGLLVDDVDQVLRITSNQIQPPPTDAVESNQFMKGVIQLDKKLIILFDVYSLMKDSEEDVQEILENNSVE